MKLMIYIVLSMGILFFGMTFLEAFICWCNPFDDEFSMMLARCIGSLGLFMGLGAWASEDDEKNDDKSGQE